MPSKGIDCYAYIAVDGCEVHFSAPKENFEVKQLRKFAKGHVDVDKNNLDGTFDFTGRFEFKVTHNGNELMHQYADINSMTGHLDSGTLKTLLETHSLVKDDLIVAYGFYDAGSLGNAGLPDNDQCYVTVTPNYSSWMGETAPPGSDNMPFSKFVLPAVHDVGMNSMANSLSLLSHAGDDVIKLLLKSAGIDTSMHIGLVDSSIGAIAPNIIESLSITQKDPVPSLLALGARYFEFRPAYVHKDMTGSPLGHKLYFQHACIPGLAYEEFLEQILHFLKANPHEIVVVQTRYDGILADCAKASDADLDQLVEEACSKSGADIVRGRQPDLNAPIAQLRQNKKRLIVMKPVNTYSTYTDAGNATYNGDSIVAEFEKLGPEKQHGNVFTNIQCQATATNIKDAVIYSAVAADASNSCLMATKAICDSKTLPWIRDHALQKLRAEQLIVVMNDFFDGATADVAIGLSRQRLGGGPGPGADANPGSEGPEHDGPGREGGPGRGGRGGHMEGQGRGEHDGAGRGGHMEGGRGEHGGRGRGGHRGGREE